MHRLDSNTLSPVECKERAETLLVGDTSHVRVWSPKATFVARNVLRCLMPAAIFIAVGAPLAAIVGVMICLHTWLLAILGLPSVAAVMMGAAAFGPSVRRAVSMIQNLKKSGYVATDDTGIAIQMPRGSVAFKWADVLAAHYDPDESTLMIATDCADHIEVVLSAFRQPDQTELLALFGLHVKQLGRCTGGEALEAPTVSVETEAGR